MLHDLSTPLAKSLKVSKSSEFGLSLYVAGLPESAEKLQHSIKRTKSKMKDLTPVLEPKEDMTEAAKKQAELRKNNRSEWSIRKRAADGAGNQANSQSKSNANSSTIKNGRQEHLQQSEKRADLKRSLSRTNPRGHADIHLSVEKQIDP